MKPVGILRMSLLFFFILPQPSKSCPCKQSSLCEPIKDTTRQEIFVFSLQNKSSSWEMFDWHKVTTVVTVGYVSQELMCLAHSYGSRVVTIDQMPASNMTNPSERTKWINEQLDNVKTNFYDGINIDFEDVILQNQTDVRKALTDLVMETTAAFKNVSPFYQVTVDVAWSPDCIDLRCYDNVGLAEASDFLFVMAYDEQSQIFGDCTARANSDYSMTEKGIFGYLKLGIKPNKLVLGVPWYGYDYTCVALSKDDVCTIKQVPFRGVNCSDAAGQQIDYRVIYPLMINGSTGGRKWDSAALSPYFNYLDKATQQMHQVHYDDPISLHLKYELAEMFDLRGVGTWNIDCLDFSDAPYAKEQTSLMFKAFPNYPRS